MISKDKVSNYALSVFTLILCLLLVTPRTAAQTNGEPPPSTVGQATTQPPPSNQQTPPVELMRHSDGFFLRYTDGSIPQDQLQQQIAEERKRLLQLASSMAEEGGLSPLQQSQVYLRMGTLEHACRQDLEAAKAYLQKAEAALQEVDKGIVPSVYREVKAMLLRTQAEILLRSNQENREELAQKVLGEALVVVRQSPQREGLEEAIIHQRQASTYITQGQFFRAEMSARRSVDILLELAYHRCISLSCGALRDGRWLLAIAIARQNKNALPEFKSFLGLENLSPRQKALAYREMALNVYRAPQNPGADRQAAWMQANNLMINAKECIDENHTQSKEFIDYKIAIYIDLGVSYARLKQVEEARSIFKSASDLAHQANSAGAEAKGVIPVLEAYARFLTENGLDEQTKEQLAEAELLSKL